MTTHQFEYDSPMARLTITLPDELQRALRETAARRGRTMGDLICESLEAYGVKPRESAAALVARARKASHLDESVATREALAAVKSVRAQRRRR